MFADVPQQVEGVDIVIRAHRFVRGAHASRPPLPSPPEELALWLRGLRTDGGPPFIHRLADSRGERLGRSRKGAQEGGVEHPTGLVIEDAMRPGVGTSSAGFSRLDGRETETG